ncbi:serine hydrolase domain-containing protein [Micromonospora sp. NPDC048935]|uniref:serine hydrolase domain-containing protein n=1 Tax=Micromonospora sp. NPDC048935 TaxID=3364262 RepID=UPI0037190286
MRVRRRELPAELNPVGACGFAAHGGRPSVTWDSPRAGQVTVGALLAHTAGLIAEAPGPWRERTPGTLRPNLPDVLGGEPQVHPAGQRHHYSNPGYALLGALVRRVRGQAWGEVLRREVLEPLAMTRTTLLPPGCPAGPRVLPLIMGRTPGR